MVLAAASAGDLVTDAPLVVVVVDVWVDAGHDEDLVRKVCQLLAAGVAHYCRRADGQWRVWSRRALPAAA
jgi:hypothetical protein